MAFRQDASTEGLTRTSGLPSSTSFTIAGWFRKRGTGDGSWEHIFGLLSSGGSNWSILYRQIAGGGVASIHGSTGDASLGVTMATDTWYYCAIGCNGTTSASLTGWVITTGGTVYTASTWGPSYTAVEMSLLKSTGYGEWVNGAAAHVMVWSTKLTQAELLQQMWSAVPIVQQASIHLWTPLWDTGALNDLSGNGRSWASMGGSPSTEDGPPVSWAAPVTWIIGQAAGGGPITGTVNQVSETDLAQAVARLKNKLLGLNAETDAAQAIARSKSKAIGQVSETDSVQAITRSKQKTVGQAEETDSAQALGTQIVGTVNQVSETDAVQAITHIKQMVLGQASETDGAQTITPAHVYAVGQVTETESAFQFTITKIVDMGQVIETDSALSLGTVIVELVGQVSEADETLSITARKVLAVSPVAETDLAQALFPQKRVAISQVIETDSAIQITQLGTLFVSVGQAVEVDSTLSILAGPFFGTAILSDNLSNIATVSDSALWVAGLQDTNVDDANLEIEPL